MTLFYLTIDSAARKLTWVRAGHDPAILYDPETDTLEELYGNGLTLGLDEGFVFEKNEKQKLEPGQIILLATDGVWETRGPDGKFFGKERVYEVIRNHARDRSAGILEAIVQAVDDFRGDREQEDDVTLVVIRSL